MGVYQAMSRDAIPKRQSTRGVVDRSETREQRPVRICVDLTPIRPGGEMGGAKVISLQLLQSLSRLRPDWQFVLLTAADSNDELAELEAHNVERRCVRPGVACKPSAEKSSKSLAILQFLPEPIIRALFHAHWSLKHRWLRPKVSLPPISLQFFPFTAPLWRFSGIPSVSIVYDLQFAYCPQFFSRVDRSQRRFHFHKTIDEVDHIVCISDYVRNTVLETGGGDPEQTTRIYLARNQIYQPANPDLDTQILSQFRLRRRRYLLYPANSWPHKNHRLLLEAFSSFLNSNSSSDLALVCTGAAVSGGIANEIRNCSAAAERIVFTGYLEADHVFSLMRHSLALIYPSLYEGFGIPVVEAMSAGVPVLCSNVASLPEVAGDAALYFNPTSKSELANAIKRIDSEPELAAELSRKGPRQAEKFGEPHRMAFEYIRLFEQMMGINGVSQAE